jgi:hypothetical protein
VKREREERGGILLHSSLSPLMSQGAGVAAAPPTLSPRVVVLRGPAGGGKSTVSALALAEVRGRGVRAVYLEQDFFRNSAAGGGKGARECARDMLVAAARAAHAAGYSVLLEGILSKEHHAEALEVLANELGPGALSFVYLNVSLEETKARHAGRAKASEFGAEKLEEWWSSAAPLGVAGEVLIASDSPLAATVAAVVALLEPQHGEVAREEGAGAGQGMEGGGSQHACKRTRGE